VYRGESTSNPNGGAGGWRGRRLSILERSIISLRMDSTECAGRKVTACVRRVSEGLIKESKKEGESGARGTAGERIPGIHAILSKRSGGRGAEPLNGLSIKKGERRRRRGALCGGGKKRHLRRAHPCILETGGSFPIAEKGPF